MNKYVYFCFHLQTGTVSTTSSMANDTTAKTKNSTTFDNHKRFEHEIQENVIANKPTVNANNKLPSPSMANDHNTALATKSTSHISFDKLIELIDSEPKRIREWNTKSTINVTRLLRLCGGGEQGINNGTTGWGSPPTAPSSAAGMLKLHKTKKKTSVMAKTLR